MVCGLHGWHCRAKNEQGDFLGAEERTSDVAEPHAMSWAAMWALQWGFNDLEMLFDSKYAYGIATGIYVPSSNCTVATVLGGICSMLQEISSVVWTHEYSHGK